MLNEEKNIAKAILEAQKMHAESYNKETGKYWLVMEHCLIETCKKNNCSKNLWSLLNLAMYWCNDIQLWAEDALAGRVLATELDIQEK